MYRLHASDEHLPDMQLGKSRYSATRQERLDLGSTGGQGSGLEEPCATWISRGCMETLMSHCSS